MPFQPLPDKGPARPGASDFGLWVIRLITVASFYYYQLLGLLKQAKDHVWEKSEWELATKASELGFPVPSVAATGFVVLLLLSTLALAIGIFTRINALVLLLLTVAILVIPLDLSPSLTPQALVLYIAVFLGLAVGGAGRVSLDHRLAGRKKRRQGNA